jgi:2-furoyl-CoA dehydrogenase large subunit
MLGGAGFHAAPKLKHRLIAIAVHDLGVDASTLAYAEGNVRDPMGRGRRTWAELVHIAHRNFHRLPRGFDPGSAGRRAPITLSGTIAGP